jgi:hypothetical protein
MIKHMSYAIEGIPLIRSFLERLDSSIKPRDASSFWESMKDYDELLDPSLWRQFYRNAIEKLVEDKAYSGGRDWNVHGFFLCESTNFHFSIKTTISNNVGRDVFKEISEDDRNTLSTRVAPAVLSVVSGHACSFDVFRLPQGASPDVFDPSVRMVQSGTRTYVPWERIEVDGPIESIELCQEAGVETCILELSMADMAFQRWEFDRRTGIPHGPVLVSAETIILMAMLDEVSRFNYTPALGQVIDLSSHQDFNVRWAVARCAAVLDADAARVLITTLLSDPHPTLRKMAAAVVRRGR